jgi:hypothetical protein
MLTTESGVFIVLDALPVMTVVTGADVYPARARVSDYPTPARSSAYGPRRRESEWTRRRQP